MPEDVGRPIGHLRALLNTPSLEPLVTEVINSINPKELEVKGGDGASYSMRIMPYKTLEHAIRGALIEFRVAPQAKVTREKH